MAIDKEAFWISPIGECITGEAKHIQMITRHPELFGFTREYVVSRFQFYHEKINWEGKARAELMNDLMEKGWIRVRTRIGHGGNEVLFQFALAESDVRKRIIHCLTNTLLPNNNVTENDLIILKNNLNENLNEITLTVKSYCSQGGV